MSRKNSEKSQAKRRILKKIGRRSKTLTIHNKLASNRMIVERQVSQLLCKLIL